MAPNRRVVNIASEQSRNWRCAEKSNAGASIISTSKARFARVARDGRFNSDSITGFQILDRRVHSNNLSRRFMTQYVIAIDYHGPNAASVPEVDIRAGNL
jgi:hypothetical protein